MNQLYETYKNVILYVFFGICTTCVNIVSYWVFAYSFRFGVMASTVIAWTFAVLFAYCTNRKWVFHSTALGINDISREVISFFACRMAVGVADWVCMFIFVDCLHMNDMVIKFLANIVVIILNYVASKLVIFNHRGQGGK